MLNYVCTVFVSNNGSVATYAQATTNTGAMNTPSAHVGKFVVVNCDPNAASLDVTAANASQVQTIKVGIVTKKNNRVVLPNGTTEYRPIIKWSNEIKAADIKSYNILDHTMWAGKTAEDTIEIDFSQLGTLEKNLFARGGKRIITRLTFKDMPHRYRKWTESYEYVTAFGDDETAIATGIANMINKEWKRARVQATATGKKVVLVALPYDDDDNVETLNVANKVRFNANVYYTDPAADGWESTNKNFPTGVVITKTPGEQYPAEAKLVRDREAWGMGYQGILNRGEGTWPIIKPDMETNLNAQYDAITLEFENMYRAADDIQRKTKQNIEIYSTSITDIKGILDAFVSGVQQDEVTNPKVTPTL